LGSRVKGFKILKNFDHYCFSIGKDMDWTKDVIKNLNQANEAAIEVKPKLQRTRLEIRI